MKAVDIIDIKKLITSGRLAVKLPTKINMLGSVLLEDTQTGEAIKLTQLPDWLSFRPSGRWESQFIYTYDQVENYMQGHDGWACSECGWITDEKHDFCVCGADMRNSRERLKELRELLDEL